MKQLVIQSKGRVDTEVIKQYIKNARKNPKQYDSIEIHRVEFKDVKAIVKLNGSKTKKFRWQPKDVLDEFDRTSELIPVKATELIKLLNMMPKLKNLTLEAIEVEEIDEVKVELKLPNLKVLHVTETPSASIYELFNKILPQNSIIEHEITKSFRNIPQSKENILREFFMRQKSIKNFSTDNNASFKFIELLTLDELRINAYSPDFRDFDEAFRKKFKLKIDSFNPDRLAVVEVLQKQPKLKSFWFQMHPNYHLKEIVDELCKLSNLEVLKIRGCSLEDCGKLKEIKTLKELQLFNIFSKNFLEIFSSETHSNLEKLETGYEISNAEVIEKLPNLKFLKAYRVTLKFNAFAKNFPNLEEASLAYNGNFKFCELDTGIVNENLKKLEIILRHEFLMDNIEELLEVFQICPNLEDFSFEADRSYEPPGEWSSKDLIEEKFFEKLNQAESLKSLKLHQISLQESANNFAQIAKLLRKLSRKLDNVEINFKDIFQRYRGVLSYKPFVKMLRKDFEIVLHVENENHSLLKVKS